METGAGARQLLTMQSEKGHKLLPELLHTTFIVSNTLIYIVLRPVLRFLTGACSVDHGAASLTTREPICVQKCVA